MTAANLSEPLLTEVVDRFYCKVRQDPLIGPVFGGAIEDWPHHLEKLSDFWSSVMLSSGRYKGNPVAQHLKHVGEIEPDMFARWLDLWRKTTSEICSAEGAAALQEKAERIAESLQLAIRFRPGEKPLAEARR